MSQVLPRLPLPWKLPPAPRTWWRFVPFRVLQLVNRICGRQPPAIAQLAADPEECDCIVDYALDYLARLQAAERQLRASHPAPAPRAVAAD